MSLPDLSQAFMHAGVCSFCRCKKNSPHSPLGRVLRQGVIIQSFLSFQLIMISYCTLFRIVILISFRPRMRLRRRLAGNGLLGFSNLEFCLPLSSLWTFGTFWSNVDINRFSSERPDGTTSVTRIVYIEMCRELRRLEPDKDKSRDSFNYLGFGIRYEGATLLDCFGS